jgi:hypothetical protein
MPLNHSYNCEVMKKILCYLSIAGAIFFPNAFCAQDAKPELGFKLAQQEYIFDYNQPSHENPFLADCLEDLFDDDSTDSEKKKSSSGKTASCNTPFNAQNFFHNGFKKILATKRFIPFKSSLFLFLCVFRL